MFRPGIVLAWLLLAWCPCALALDPSLDISQYAHTTWKSRDGFVRGYVSDIVQTPDGYLWLGTEFGLYRFDGVRAVPWQAPAGQQLPDDLIISLLAARDGTLWIGTLRGLATWKDGKLKTYPELSGLGITALLQDRDGTIWIGSRKLEGRTVAQLCSALGDHLECRGGDGRFGPMILSLYEDSKGNLWAGVAKGLWKWKPGVPEFVAAPQSLNGITGFAEDAEGAILVGDSSTSNMMKLVDGRLEPYSLRGSSRALAPQRLLRDREGGLWVGSLGFGLAHIYRGRVDTFSEADGLSGSFVNKVFEDREGNIWAGTMNGLDRFREYAVPNVSVKQGLAIGVATSLLAANDGSIWIATNGGLNVWKNGHMLFVGARFGNGSDRGKLSGFPPASLFQDSTGRIWIATRSGFGYLENGRYVPIRDYLGGDVLDIVEGSPGHLWLATQYAGLLHFFNAKMVEKVPWVALGHKDIGRALVLDPSRAGIWIGFVDGGIAYFTGGRIQKQYAGAEGLGRGKVNHLRFGLRGALWVGTESGLSWIKDGNIATLTSKNGLPCDNVHWSVEDSDHNAWLKTPCGVLRITRSDMDAWVASPATVVKATVFDVSDGVPDRRATTGYAKPVVTGSDGKIWFTGLDGVSVIDPHHLPFNKLPPPVHIEQITADRQTYDAAQGQRLSAGVRDLQIDYTALSFVAPEKARFRVKLEGWDADWKDVGTERKAFYSNLPPRNYRFRVMACNNSGVWNEAGAFLDFSIAPTIYQRTSFRVLVGAVFLALLFAAYRARVQRVRRQEQKLRGVIETIPVMTWTTLPDGSVDFVNRQWLEYTGLSIEQNAGSGWQAIVHPEDLEQHLEKRRVSIETGQPFESEVRYRRGADGQYRRFLARLVPLRDAKGKIIKWYGSSTDIEERERLRQLEVELAHTNRVSMLGELTASLAHEINQPIAAAITSAGAALRWLNREQPEVQRAQEAVIRIEHDGRRAAEIITRLKTFYKKEASPQRETVAVNEVVGEMLVLLHSEAVRHSVVMRTELAAELPMVLADRVQLQQVLMNLMLNGIEAMGEAGGEIKVRTRREGGEVLVSVSDTGEGIPADKLEHIFNTFFTTKAGGTGMGLAISRTIIESHGGRLWASDNNGRGATFHFTLPVEARQG